MFCVGFGVLGGILLRLAVTTGSRVDFCPTLCQSGRESDWEDCDILETKDDGYALAWDIITPSERINDIASITATIDLHKEFMVLLTLENVLLHLSYICFLQDDDELCTSMTFFLGDQTYALSHKFKHILSSSYMHDIYKLTFDYVYAIRYINISFTLY